MKKENCDCCGRTFNILEKKYEDFINETNDCPLCWIDTLERLKEREKLAKKEVFDDIDKMLKDNCMIYIDDRVQYYKVLKKKHLGKGEK